jgi:hypothetical protein
VACVNLLGDGNAVNKDTEAVLIASKKVQVNCQENEAYILSSKMKVGQSQRKCNNYIFLKCEFGVNTDKLELHA